MKPKLSNLKAWVSTLIAILYIVGVSVLYYYSEEMDQTTWLTAMSPATLLLFTDLLKERKK